MEHKKKKKTQTHAPFKKAKKMSHRSIVSFSSVILILLFLCGNSIQQAMADTFFHDTPPDHHRHLRNLPHHQTTLAEELQQHPLSVKERYLCEVCEDTMVPLLAEAIVSSEEHHHPTETLESLLESMMKAAEEEDDEASKGTEAAEGSDGSGKRLSSASLSFTLPEAATAAEEEEAMTNNNEEQKKKQKREQERMWLREHLSHLLWDRESLRRLSAVQTVYHRYPDRRKHLEALLYYVACACGDHSHTHHYFDEGSQHHHRRRMYQQHVFHLENRGFQSLLEKHSAVIRRMSEEDRDDEEQRQRAREDEFSAALFSSMMVEGGGGGPLPRQPSTVEQRLEQRLGMPGFGGMATGLERQGEEL